MEKKKFFGLSAIAFIIAMLFTPKDSEVWIAFLLLAIISAVIWFLSKE